MEHYKIIFLIIATPSSFYNKNKRVLNKFMNKNPNIKTLFIYGNVDKNNVFHTDHDLYFDVSESIVPGCLKKTVKAFEYVNENYTYDYLIRTNLSTFWNLNKILKKVEKFPNKRCLAGDIRTFRNIKYIFGTGLIYSKDLVDILVKDKDKLNYKKADDIVLSMYLKDNYKIKYINEPRCTKFMRRMPRNNEDIPKRFSHYRLKSIPDRQKDHVKMSILLKYLNK